MAVRLTIRVTPRASGNRITGREPDGTLKLAVTAAPVDGEANAAVLKLLAKALGVPGRDLEIVSGATARVKVVEVDLGECEVERRLAEVTAGR